MSKNKYSVCAMCRAFDVTAQGYYSYAEGLNKPDKDEPILLAINEILQEDEYNDNYGRERMCKALAKKGIKISHSKYYRICSKYGINRKLRKTKGITKQDRKAKKSEDLLQGDFRASEPRKKYITDITQLPTRDGKLYVSAVFDCYNAQCVGLTIAKHMQEDIVIDSFKQAMSRSTGGEVIFHSDTGSQYTSNNFRKELAKREVSQSMNLAKLSCYGNARCESMFARFKVEAIYDRYDTKNMSFEDVKTVVFRYFMGYWNNRRICSAIGCVTPREKLDMYYASEKTVA